MYLAFFSTDAKSHLQFKLLWLIVKRASTNRAMATVGFVLRENISPKQRQNLVSPVSLVNTEIWKKIEQSA
jgi:hypothetical protein